MSTDGQAVGSTAPTALHGTAWVSPPCGCQAHLAMEELPPAFPLCGAQPESPEHTFFALPLGDPTAAGTGMYVEEMYKHCLCHGYCYHTNKTPDFHFPQGFTSAPREVHQGSSHCMNAEMQPLGVPPCLTSFADMHLCDELCSCGASQTYTHLPGTSLQLLGWLLLPDS